MEKIVIYTDGGSRGNPGPSAIGYKIIQPSTGEFLCIGEEIGETTNNIAEYTALCESLRVCLCNHVKSVEVYMDSELVVKQIIGNYRVKNINLKPLYEQAKNYISQLSDFSIHHILRGKNKEADRWAFMPLARDLRISSSKASVSRLFDERIEIKLSFCFCERQASYDLGFCTGVWCDIRE